MAGLFLLLTISVYGQTTPDLKRSLQRQQSDSARALTLIELGRNYIQLNLDSSWHYLNQAIMLSQKLPDKRVLIKAYNVLATSYVVTGEHKKGLAILRKAEQLSHSYPLDTIQLELQTRLMQLYRIQGDYKQALRSGLTLERIIEKRPDLQASPLLTLYTELALVYEHQNSDSLALPYYLKANDFAMKRKKQKALIGTLGNLGEYYINHQEFAKAKRYTQQSLAISRAFQFNHSTAESLRNLGEISRLQRRYKDAIGYYNQALAIQQQIGAKEFIGLIYLQLAQSYLALRDLARSLTYVDQSIALFRAIQSAHYLHKALLFKVTLQEKSGRFQNALALMQQAQRLQDSLTGLEKQKAIAQIQSSFDLERKQHQITNLKRDLTLQQQAKQTIQLQLTLAQNQRTFYSIISTLLLLLAVIIYINFNRQKKAQELLSQQKQAIFLQTEQLIELNKTKDQLFSIISHDLRSPLVHLKQDIQHMQQDVLSDKKPTSASLATLEHKTDNILSLLMTLLDWAYVQFSGFKTALKVIDLTEQINQTIGYFADRIQQKQITVINQVNEHTPVVADAQQLAIVLRNLVDNALKFTPVGGYIRLFTVEHSNKIELQIRDTGIGMTAEMLDRLFTKPDVREGTQQELGTGLGIQISRELIQKQNGELHVKSQLHKGTTVNVLLGKP